MDAKDYERAIAFYEKILDLDNKNINARAERGLALFSLEYYLDAIEDYDIVLAKRTNDTHSYYNRGTCKWRIGDLYGAKKDLKKAVDLSKVDNLENIELNERAKKMGAGWGSAAHIYETFYFDFLTQYDRAYNTGVMKIYSEMYEKAARKIRHAPV